MSMRWKINGGDSEVVCHSGSGTVTTGCLFMAQSENQEQSIQQHCLEDVVFGQSLCKCGTKEAKVSEEIKPTKEMNALPRDGRKDVMRVYY